MSEKAVFLLSEVKELSSGKNSRGKWHLWGLIDRDEEVRGTFFNSTLKEKAEGFEGQYIEVELEENDNGYTAKSVKKADSPPENGDTPRLGTGEYIKGQAAPSDARRMLIRGAHDNAAFVAIEALKFQTAREITPDLVKATLSSFIDFFWLDSLRKADLMEDRDIPFMPEYEGQ